MSIISAACVAMLHTATPSCGNLADHHIFASSALADADLASIHGMGIPLVGLDQQQAAANASMIVVGELGPRPSDIVREVTDNWTSEVATPLIAAATSALR